ncbi:hypothetical protein ACOME3_003906 [Neoechinorhynchus agilis]
MLKDKLEQADKIQYTEDRKRKNDSNASDDQRLSKCKKSKSTNRESAPGKYGKASDDQSYNKDDARKVIIKKNTLEQVEFTADRKRKTDSNASNGKRLPKCPKSTSINRELVSIKDEKSTNDHDELYNDNDARKVINKLRLYSKKCNEAKMKHYLKIVKDHRFIYERAIKACGEDWLRDKFYRYLFSCHELPDWPDETKIHKPSSIITIPDATKPYIADVDLTARPSRPKLKRNSGTEYSTLAGIKCPRNLLALSNSKDIYEDEDIDKCKIATLKKGNYKGVIDGIKEKFSKIEMDKMMRSFEKKPLIQEHEKKQHEAEKKRLYEEEIKFIIKCTTRRTNTDANEVAKSETDPTIKEEKLHYDSFTSNVKTYVYDGRFPVIRIIEYMVDFCDLYEMLIFEKNNPELKDDLQLLWKRRCKLDYDVETLKFSNCWKQTYIHYWRFVNSISDISVIDIPTQVEEDAAKSKNKLVNPKDNSVQKTGK